MTAIVDSAAETVSLALELDATIGFLLEFAPDVPSAVGARWLVRAREHLEDRLEAALRGAARPPRDEQEFVAVLRQLASELDDAAAALDVAAAHLKSCSKGYQAAQARQAALAARETAERIVPR